MSLQSERFRRPAKPLQVAWAAVIALAYLAQGTTAGAQESRALANIGVSDYSPEPWIAPSTEFSPQLYLHLPTSFLADLEVHAAKDCRPLAPELTFPEQVRACSCDMEYRSDLIAAIYSVGDSSILIDAGNSLFGLPQNVLGACISVGNAIFPACGCYSIRDEDAAPLTVRMLALNDESPMREPFVEGVRRLVVREQSYFAGFAENPLYSFSVEEGYTEIDYRAFKEDQRKIMLDVLRKTYFSKYLAKVEDRVRDDAWQFDRWSGVDYVLGPPLVAAYAWLRGIDRKIKMGNVKIRIALEPLQRIDEIRHDNQQDLVGALTFELAIGDFPIRGITSFGYHNGNAEMDFIGIGTSVGEAKKSVSMLLAVEEPESNR